LKRGFDALRVAGRGAMAARTRPKKSSSTTHRNRRDAC
jgi:hypothetical protein